MDSQEHQLPQLKKKYIIFRNQATNQIYTKIQIPSVVRLTNKVLCRLDSLRSQLKLLYIDVLVGTIWRCLSRQIGQPLKNYNIYHVRKQLQSYLSNLTQILTQKAQALPQSNPQLADNPTFQALDQTMKQMKQLQLRIKQVMNTIIVKCQRDQEESEEKKKHIRRVMGQQILDLEREIFCKTLIGVRECEDWEGGDGQVWVQLVLQQCYPYIKMLKKDVIRKIGLQQYNYKSLLYQKNLQNHPQPTQTLIVCHRCLTPIPPTPSAPQCNNTAANLSVGHTLLTDPYMYRKQLLNENSWQREQQSYIHPYLIYYPWEGKAVCNRVYCAGCVGREMGLSYGGCCGFCEGVCNCGRCEGMDLLTKVMAVFLDNGGELGQLVKEFMMKYDGEVEVSAKCRKTPKLTQQKPQLFEQYNQCFTQQQILIPYKSLPATHFQKTYFFPERIQQQHRDQLHVYRTNQSTRNRNKVKLPDSFGERLERLEKEKNRQMEVEELRRRLERGRGDGAGGQGQGGGTGRGVDGGQEVSQVSMESKGKRRGRKRKQQQNVSEEGQKHKKDIFQQQQSDS